MDQDAKALKFETDSSINKIGKVIGKISKNRWYNSQCFVVKALELILSVSLCSLLLSFFTGQSIFHSYIYYFSTFMLPFLTHTLERKYMFLLCNGILVFLARKSLCSSFAAAGGSSMCHDQRSFDDHILYAQIMMQDEDVTADPAASVLGVETATTSLASESIVLTEGYQRERHQRQENNDHDVAAEANITDQAQMGGDDQEVVVEVVEEQPIEKENGDYEDDGDDDYDDIENGSSMMVGGGGGNGVENQEGPSSSTDELNKKIEDFIRKMKEELRLEAQQQQLIAA